MTIDKYGDLRQDGGRLSPRAHQRHQYAGERIITNLGEKNLTVVEMGEGFVIIATDLSPADTAQMKIDRVLGFATDMGGKTSHKAIVARSLEIPAVLGLENITRSVQNNDYIIIDGSAGVVIVRPDPEVRKRYEDKKRLHEEAQDDLLDYAKLPAVTKDSYSVKSAATSNYRRDSFRNCPRGGRIRLTDGVHHIGRTPDEEDHLANYRSETVSRAFPGRPSAPWTWAATSFTRTPRLPVN